MRRIVMLLAVMGATLLLGSGMAMAATLFGTTANDTINGTNARDQIFGLQGADTLFGSGGNDEVRGGAGQDKVNGGVGNDVLSGGKNSDVLIGGPGRDFLNSRGQGDNDATDSVSCGTGFDTVAADLRDAVSSDCERVTRIEDASNTNNTETGA